ncbi:hypothetical protein, partial [Paenibacillus mendelii]
QLAFQGRALAVTPLSTVTAAKPVPCSSIFVLLGPKAALQLALQGPAAAVTPLSTVTAAKSIP